MYKKYQLQNGVRVILAPLHDTQTVTVLIAFGVGSRFEEQRINGISHFIEHMMFKGTAKRPTTLDISKELDSVGAEYNAYTGKDVTAYYVKISQDKLPLALDMVSDMLFNSKFDAGEIEREKGVICEEIHMYQDNPLMHVDTLLEEGMFAGSSLGWDIAGSDETVKGMTRDDMMAYIAKHYEARNIVVGVSGNFDDATAEALVTQAFEREWTHPEMLADYVPVYMNTTPPERVMIQKKETEQVQMALGFPALPYLHPDMPALTVLSIILGGNMSSRLFINIRERLGLCYYIKAVHQPYKDTGSFYVQAGMDKKRIDEAVTAIRGELSKLVTGGITAEELNNAKEYLKGKMALQLEDSESVVSWYVTQEIMTKETLTPAEKLAKVFAVTVEDVQRVAGDMFKIEKATLAIIGPYEDKAQFERLLA